MRAIDAVAKALYLLYFLVGAMARDMLLGHVFGLNPGRATRAWMSLSRSQIGSNSSRYRTDASLVDTSSQCVMSLTGCCSVPTAALRDTSLT
jgi:hypothetical protein